MTNKKKQRQTLTRTSAFLAKAKIASTLYNTSVRKTFQPFFWVKQVNLMGSDIYMVVNIRMSTVST